MAKLRLAGRRPSTHYFADPNTVSRGWRAFARHDEGGAAGASAGALPATTSRNDSPAQTPPDHTTPACFIRATSSALTPQISDNSSSVCSPSSGGRVISAGESDSLIGDPTVL